MFTILGTDGKEYGPVAVAKIQEWMLAGRANLQTKARRANETEWRTLGDFSEFGSTAVPLAMGEPVIAAAPAFAPATPPGTPGEIAASLIARTSGTSFDPFSCITRSFELWKQNLLPLVGVTLLSLVIQMIVGFIPLVGLTNTFFFAGVFTGGLHYYYLGKMRGQPRGVEDIFAGFRLALGRLGLTNLLLITLIIAVMLPFFASALGVMVPYVLAHPGSTPPPPPPLAMGAILLMLVGLIPLTYLSIAWSFAYTLVIDQGLGPWTALEVSRRVITRRWFAVFILMICSGLLVLLGLLGFVIGIFFTLPLGFGSLLYAYEDLCRPPSS